MKLIGFERADFKIRATGEEVTGMQLYLARSITPDKGEGSAVERVYLTDRKLATNNFDPMSALGKDVVLYYNRWGKIERITLDP